MAIDYDRLAELAAESHFYKGRFRNTAHTPSHGLRGFLRWQLEPGRRFPPGKRFPLLKPDQHQLHHPPQDPQLTWLGHSSFLFQFDQLNILTDPVFSERASPFPFAGPKRYTPAALNVKELPSIDVVLISHNHYDHLDDPTIRQIKHRFGDNVCFCVPQGLKTWFNKRGITNLIELDWWQFAALPTTQPTTHVEPTPTSQLSHQVFCLPTQHFSGRSGADQNRTLWCSWLVQVKGYRFYFGGDTGYAPVFKQIGELFAPIDLALIPIGAYAPRWFMAPYHIAPEESVHIHQDIGAKQSVAMHWGTFVLTDEPMDEPPRRLHKVLEEAGLSKNAFKVMQHGETNQFPR